MKKRPPLHFVLRLFVTAHSPRSSRAIVNIRRICEENLAGRYELQIVDVSGHPDVAVAEQIVATPTLIKLLPEPLRRFIGDMSQTEHLLLGLEIRKGRA